MLDELPFELLSHIYSHLTTAQSVSRLSITCRALHDFTGKEGWKVFLRNRFPSLPMAAQPSDYREASHGLTTLSRNWDRKALLARYLEPSGSITSLPTWQELPRWDRPQGQTMGYQPSIDSYEEWTSGDWSSRKQILAWSAGTELLVRVKNTGRDTQKLWNTASARDRKLYFDQYKHLVKWYKYKIPESMEGRDDITSLNVVKPLQKEPGAERVESFVFGTADGGLSRLDIELKGGRFSNTQAYTAPGGVISSTAISPSRSPLLAACHSASKIALYPVHGAPRTEPIGSISQLDMKPEGTRNTCRIWSANFLSEDKLAVGVGPSSEPLHVYEVRSTGIVESPVRTFGFETPDSHRLDGLLSPTANISSTYSVVPLPPSALGGHASGQVFLSGDYDGTIRLHDLRSPSSSECSYWDSANGSAVYSLQTQGRERIVAGMARHTTLMVYDLRVSGGRAYRNIEVAPPKADPRNASNARHPNPTREKAGEYKAHYNWTLFMSPRTDSRLRQAHDRRQTHTGDSPIYSLSIPSASSPTVFAGVENGVYQLDFTSILDRYPDPVFAPTIERTQRGEIDVKTSWNPNGDVMNLSMYDKTDETSLGMNLWTQAGVGLYKGAVASLDERWRDPSEVDHFARRPSRWPTPGARR